MGPSNTSKLGPAAQVSNTGNMDLSQQVQQPAAAAASSNCAVQRLHNKLRLHNSTDPRPKAAPSALKKPPPAAGTAAAAAAQDRGSVLSVSSCGSRCSSNRSTRFSFGLDLFRFCENKHGSCSAGNSGGGGRGSGWSLWFRQDDGGKSGKSNMNELGSQEKLSA